jgi:hypothetical protein
MEIAADDGAGHRMSEPPLLRIVRNDRNCRREVYLLFLERYKQAFCILDRRKESITRPAMPLFPDCREPRPLNLDGWTFTVIGVEKSEHQDGVQAPGAAAPPAP